jgi:hypothetical protein
MISAGVSKDLQHQPQQQDDRDVSFYHHNFSSLLSPMAPMENHRGKSTSSSSREQQVHSLSTTGSNSNRPWDPTRSDVTAYSHTNTNNVDDDTLTNQWSMESSTSVIGSQLEGREISSQHSRGDERRNSNSSGSRNATGTNGCAGNIWGTKDHHPNQAPPPPPPPIHGSNTDEFSKSSHTSTTSTVLFPHPPTSFSSYQKDSCGTADDINADVFHDGPTYHHHRQSSKSNNGNDDDEVDPVMESSRFLSSLQLQGSGFDHHHSNYHDSAVSMEEQKKNQPPKQPVRRPSYGYNQQSTTSLLSSSSISSSNEQYPLFVVPNSHSHDSNASSVYSYSQQQSQRPEYSNRSNPDLPTSSSYYGSDSRMSDTYSNNHNTTRNAPSSLSSALQMAANANPYYPTHHHPSKSSSSSTYSVTSTIPGLMNAHSGSVTTTKTTENHSSSTHPYSSAGTLYPPPPVVISSSSSLAVAAATASASSSMSKDQRQQQQQYNSKMMFGGPPPPGFLEDTLDDTPDDFGTRELSRPHRFPKGSSLLSHGRSESRGHSPTALKDRNANLPQYHHHHINNRSFGQLGGGGGDMKDDVHSVTSTTTATTAASLRSYQVPQPQPYGSSSQNYLPPPSTSIGPMESSMSSSQALRALMDNTLTAEPSSYPASERRQSSSLLPSSLSSIDPGLRDTSSPILPQPVIQDDYFLSSIERDMERLLQRQTFFSSSNNNNEDGYESLCHIDDEDFDFINDDDQWSDGNSSGGGTGNGSHGNASVGGDGTLSLHHPTKKREWLHRMNRKLNEIPIGELDSTTVPILAIMNAWAKTKSAQGAAMVELWLKRAQEEYDSGNRCFVPTTKMYTMAGTYFFLVEGGLSCGYV